MVNIKLNEFDRKLLANIKPSDKWDKLKNIYILNSEIKRLKIQNNKIGTKCSKHLQNLSTKSNVSLNEIKDKCKDLVPKKHKHGLAKDKTKRDKETTHAIKDISGQSSTPLDKKKDEKPKHKKQSVPTKTKPPGPTQQLVNLLTTQQTIARQQTIASNIARVDQILTDRNQNYESPSLVRQSPQQIQSPNLQLRTQTLGTQKIDNSGNLRLSLLEGSLLDREKGLTSMQRSLERQTQILKQKKDNVSLLESVVEDKEKKQRIGNSVENYVNKERTRYKQLVMDGRMTPQQAQQNIQNLNNTYINSLQNREAEETQSKNVMNDMEELERMRQFKIKDRKVGVDSVLRKLKNRKNDEEQKRIVNDLLMSEKQKRIELMNENDKKFEDIQSDLLGSVKDKSQRKETLSNLQLGVMDRVSGLAEQQDIFNTNYDNPLRLKRDTSTSAFDIATTKPELKFKKTPSESDVAFTTGLTTEDVKELIRERKEQEQNIRTGRSGKRISRRKQRKDLEQKARAHLKAQRILELQKEEEETFVASASEDKPIKKEITKQEKFEDVAMEENKPPTKMMSPEDVIGKPKTRYITKGQMGTPSQVYGNPDSNFYNKNYKDILQEYVDNSRRDPIYNKPMKNNYAQTWDIINKVNNAKIYKGESKTKDLRHRKEYQKDLLIKLHSRNVEQLMDRYLLEKNPVEKEYYKYAGIAAEQYLKSENPNEDPQYKLFNKINKRKGLMSPDKFIEESKLLDKDNIDSTQWEQQAKRLSEFHNKYEKMSESDKRSYTHSAADTFSAGLGQGGFNELPY